MKPASRPLPWLMLCLSCWAPELAPPGGVGADATGPADPGLRFVEGGVVVPGEVGAEGIPLTEGRVLVPRSWRPGREVEVLGSLQRALAVAPSQAACVLLYRVGVGGQAPTAVAFSDDGRRLRIERDRRDPLVVDAWLGDEVDGGGFVAAEGATSPMPPRCPGDQVHGPALVGPDHRYAVIEGPFAEPSGETGWRVAVFR